MCILSNRHADIQDFIVNRLNRGVTLYQAKGGFNQEEKVEVVTILARSEYAALMNYLQETDANAFVTVSPSAGRSAERSLKCGPAILPTGIMKPRMAERSWYVSVRSFPSASAATLSRTTA